MKKNHNKINLIILPTEKTQNKIDNTVNKLVKNKTSIFYLSFNKPYSVLSQNWKRKKINLKKILFVDCITSSKRKNGENAIFNLSPRSLTEISLAFTTFLKTSKDQKAIIIDSLSTLLIYDELNLVARFTNDIIEKARQSEAKVIIFTTNVEELINKISLFFDKIERGAK